MKKKCLIWVGFAICIALLVVSSFFDLSISHQFYDSENFYAKFFDIFGEFPLYAIFPLSLCIIFSYLKRNSNNFTSIFICSICVVGSFVASSLCYQRFFGSLIPFFIVFALAIATVALLNYWFGSMSDVMLDKLFVFAKFAIIFATVLLLVNQGIKFVWGRARYYTMAESGDFSPFSNWWQIQWFAGGKSFYSGHVTSAMSLFCLLPLARLLGLEKRKVNLLIVLILLFVVLVAVARVIYGAHFLSDVVMAIIISGIIYLILSTQFYKLYYEKL